MRYQQLSGLGISALALAGKSVDGPYLVPYIAVMSAVIAAQFVPLLAGRVTVGDDGVLVSIFGWKKWIAARRIARVHGEKQIVTFELRDGTTEKVHLSKPDDVVAIVRRFTTAQDDACEPSLAPLAVELETRMRSRLDGTTPIRAQAYRDAAMDETHLAAILASPLVTPLARAGAAIELGSSRARIAEAREHVAHPALGALLDAVANGEDGAAAWRAVDEEARRSKRVDIPAEVGEPVASAPAPAEEARRVRATKRAGDAFEQHGYRVVPNVAIHVLAAPTRYMALLGLPLALLTRVPQIAIFTTMAAGLGRLPWVFVRERNPGKKEQAAHVTVRDRVVHVDGERVCDASELTQGFVHHAPGNKPTVRLVRRGVRFPIELRFEREQDSRDFLACLGFDADQAAATFTTLIPKTDKLSMVKWLGVPMMLAVALIVIGMRHHLDLMTTGVGAMWLMMVGLFLERRVVVRPDGVELRTPLSRTRFIAFGEIERVERTKDAGTLHLVDGTTVPLRSTMNDQRSEDRNDALVERVLDAWHASREERVRVEESGTFVRIGEEEDETVDGDEAVRRCASVRR